MPVIDHLGIHCPFSQMTSLVTFYSRILAPLGIVQVLDQPGCVGFGKGSDGEPVFEIFREDDDNTSLSERRKLHFAFVADSRLAVREFHAMGLDQGMKSNGGPAVREHYSPTYFAAFLEDPLGNGIEAVCQKHNDE